MLMLLQKKWVTCNRNMNIMNNLTYCSFRDISLKLTCASLKVRASLKIGGLVIQGLFISKCQVSQLSIQHWWTNQPK